jgi:MFS family permease
MAQTENIESTQRIEKLILGVAAPVFILGLVSLLTDISSEMIVAILPLFVFEVGGTVIVLGLITGITEATANILKGVSGWWSDKIRKKKPFIVAGYSLSNLTKPLMGFSISWEPILALKFTDRIGKGIRTSPRDALISVYAEEGKGKAFGIHRAMDTTGAVIGSLVTSILLIYAFNYGSIILLSIIPGLGAIFLILTVKERKQEKISVKISELETKNEQKVNKTFIKFVVILGVMEFASLDVTFLIARGNDLIPSDSVFLLPIFYLLFNIVYVLFSPVAGNLSDKIGRKKVIVIGLSLLIGVCIFAAIPIQVSTFSIVLIAILFGIYGLYCGMVDPVARAYVGDLTGKDKRGRGYGYYYLSIGLISLPESIIFGLVYEIVGFTWAFIYITILLIISVIIFVRTDFSKILSK